MKRIYIVTGLILGLAMHTAIAGNPDRVGQAGATELLINPWSRSLGWNGVNIASIRGIESMRFNPAGLTLQHGTEIGFSRTQYLGLWDVGINAAGFSTKMGDGALGLSLMSMSLGEIEVSDRENVEGELGTYTPQFMNLGIAYSHSFADYIHGGVVIRVINESISNVSATGICLDAGLMYNTGPEGHPDKFKFGVAIRNVGTPMRFDGEGLAFRSNVISEKDYEQLANQRTESFELPSLLNIGASYDFYISNKHKLTMAASFTSNSFYKDNIGIGAEYAMKIKGRELVNLRIGFKYEDGMFDEIKNTSAHGGLAAGFSFNIPFSDDDKGSKLVLNYGFRSSSNFSGTHAFGLSVNF